MQRAGVTGSRKMAALAFLAITATTTAAIGYIHVSARSAAESEAAMLAPSQLPVTVRPVHLEQGYQVERYFVGLVQPRRAVSLSFQTGGALQEVLGEIGDRVEAGVPLARLDRRRLESRQAELEASLRQTEAHLAFAETEARRQDDLARRGNASQQARDQAGSTAQALRAQRDALQAQLENVRIELADSELRAPFSGLIAERLLDEGAVVAIGQPVFRLIEQDRAEVHVGLPSEQAQALHPGDDIELAWRGRRLPGKLRALVPEISGSSRTLIAVVTLPPEAEIASGEAVEMVRREWVDGPGFWLPSHALVAGERGLWAVQVAVSTPEGRMQVRRAAVEVLHQNDSRAFVRGTLNEGDLVLVEGPHRVPPGRFVAPQMAAAPGLEPVP
ncbi:efflux RND transporter periplasmic adaptor subunit [Telmatospirillum sp. J64-1]|uniref:efflux RND transporter periplasmic adaptor subunit n=1 Tax=Telmatospirillum sp. J64-1 TaxID=2502183 RepID=UPI00163D4777|nr:efflux RND transporter periplasmic adaptor subunit [Telmatospirillum sp. J64-1]